jgi:hypothetical protein
LADTQADLDAVGRVLVAEARSGSRQARIEELLGAGQAMLDEPDIAKANAFFRRLVRVYTQGGRVVHVETP